MIHITGNEAEIKMSCTLCEVATEYVAGEWLEYSEDGETCPNCIEYLSDQGIYV